MYNINIAIVEGNLTRDPEIKALPSGSSVTTFSIATNRKYLDKDGKPQEDVQYHNIVVYGKSADNCAKYLTKGSSAYVVGRNETRSWEKDGVKQYRTEIVADHVTFGSKSGVQTPATDNKAGSVLPDYPEEEINPDDIPF